MKSIFSAVILLCLMMSTAAFAQDPTDTFLSASPGVTAPATTPVTLTATVADAINIENPTGTVSFYYDDTNLIGTVSVPTSPPCTVNASCFILTTESLPVGIHTLLATYAPDTDGWTGSVSTVFTPITYEITPAPPPPVPALGGWAEIGMIGLMLVLGTGMIRRRNV